MGDITTTLDALPVPCVHCTARGVVSAINPSAANLLGTSQTGRHYATLFRSPAMIVAIEAGLQGNTVVPIIHRLRQNGRNVEFIAHITPLPPHEGVLVTLLDQSAQQAAHTMRADFVANVSHELRTPLTAISGIVETLQGPATDDAAQRAVFLNMLEKETGRMTSLVEDLLALGNVEDPDRRHPAERCDITLAAREAIKTLSPKANDKGTNLLSVGFETPVYVMGVQDQLRRLFVNLIDNAIKYGKPDGRVTVTVEALDFHPVLGRSTARIAVDDNGEGVAPEHLHRLTERFYRVDKHRSRELGGTGLGLAIVKHIVTHHRGKLRINSVLGRGSTVTVLLPLAM